MRSAQSTSLLMLRFRLAMLCFVISGAEACSSTSSVDSSPCSFTCGAFWAAAFAFAAACHAPFPLIAGVCTISVLLLCLAQHRSKRLCDGEASLNFTHGLVDCAI